MNIEIDDREDVRRIKSCVKFFTGKDYSNDITEYHGNLNHVFIKKLTLGDYVFDKKVAFEYKSPSDMINSIIDNRVFRQSRELKQYPYSYIMIVGDVPAEINRRNEPQYYNKYNKLKKFTIKNFLGSLARLYTYTNVINVQNNQQCWILMDYLVSKLLKDNDVMPLDKPNFKLVDPVSSFLGLIYVNGKQRISRKQAVLIREHLHLETLQDLVNVEYEDLVGIKGIGSKTARAVIDVIK